MAARQLGNLSKHFRELRFHLCQKSSSSAGLRGFIEKEYVGVKQENPSFPILIRECSNVEPKIYARYENRVAIVDCYRFWKKYDRQRRCIIKQRCPIKQESQ